MWPTSTRPYVALCTTMPRSTSVSTSRRRASLHQTKHTTTCSPMSFWRFDGDAQGFVALRILKPDELLERDWPPSLSPLRMSLSPHSIRPRHCTGTWPRNPTGALCNADRTRGTPAAIFGFVVRINFDPRVAHVEGQCCSDYYSLSNDLPRSFSVTPGDRMRHSGNLMALEARPCREIARLLPPSIDMIHDSLALLMPRLVVRHEGVDPSASGTMHIHRQFPRLRP